MSSTATQTYQESVQNLQSWLDFLAEEEERLTAQLAKMQGGSSIPEIEADAPYVASEDLHEDFSDLDRDDAEEEPEKWT